MPPKNNPIVIRPDTKIGNSSAENDDEFLISCFVDHPTLAPIQTMGSPEMFLLGRTGSGKTAILKKVEHNNDSVSAIDLHDLALNYIANSDIIRFLNSIDVDLDLFFQLLWKHVLCIEYVRMRFNVKTTEDSRRIFDRIKELFFEDRRKEAALKYLGRWESKFWITMDVNIKQITSKFENEVNASLGAEVNKFTANAGYARTLSSEKRAEVSNRARKIVNADQLTELSRVLDLLSEYDTKDRNKGKNYILVDKIDERWVDESIRFKLIRALVESLKSFRKLRCLKIIVSIRSDVIERVVQETNDAGFQREKYDDYFMKIKWDKELLRKLIDKRINYLYRRKYTTENVHFNDVFIHYVGQKNPFDYMIERTLYRPRDIISFVNLCLETAQGKENVTAKDIRSAEGKYSQIRLQALNEEWQSALPSLKIALPVFAKQGARFSFSSISSSEFIEDLILKIYQDKLSPTDPIAKECNKYVDDPKIDTILKIARMVTCELYRIGAIGVKLSSQERHIYSYNDTSIIHIDQISTETRIHIHPMLHRALNLSE